MSKFTHLHTHSHYSLLDGLAKIDDLLTRTKELGMNALAITDHGVLYGAVAGVTTLLLFYPFTYWLGGATENFFGGVNVFTYYIDQFPLFFLMIVGAGVILGVISAFLAVRRYLTV